LGKVVKYFVLLLLLFVLLFLYMLPLRPLFTSPLSLLLPPSLVHHLIPLFLLIYSSSTKLLKVQPHVSFPAR